jgi:nucleotide-binding universal stress UspA family protein
MFGTTVVGVDGSGPAARAVETVAKIAAGTKDQVVVCHGVAVARAWGTDLPAETTGETQPLVDRYVALLAAAGVPANGELHQVPDKGIGDALIDVARSHRAGLIVVGTRAARTSSRCCWAAWRTKSCPGPRCRCSWCRAGPARRLGLRRSARADAA